MSVFFDMLTHPGADLGNAEGPPLVDWRRRQDLAVDHVVLGILRGEALVEFHK